MGNIIRTFWQGVSLELGWSFKLSLREAEEGVELNIDEDISFIDEDDINEDDDVSEEIIDENK